MADNWDGAPQDYTTGEVPSATKWRREIRDRMDALKAGLTDSSVDADIKQAVKAGTLAARPAASLAGRQYFATDVLANYMDDGTRWQHVAGRGAFDSFDRATSTTLGNAESGHPWVEESGDIQINAGGELENVSGTGIATVDTGGVIHTAKYRCHLGSGATLGSFDASLVLKYVDASNYLYLQFLGGSDNITLNKREAGVGTTLASWTTAGLEANKAYLVTVDLIGSVIYAQVYEGLPYVGIATLVHADDEDLMGSYINTATKSGVRLLNTTNSRSSAFSMVPNG